MEVIIVDPYRVIIEKRGKNDLISSYVNLRRSAGLTTISSHGLTPERLRRKTPAPARDLFMLNEGIRAESDVTRGRG